MFEYKKFYDYRNQELTEKLEEVRLNDSLIFYEKYRNQMVARPCPICGTDAPLPLGRFRETFPVVTCGRCASVYVNPCPTEEMLNDYYNSAESIKILDQFFIDRLKTDSGRFVVDQRVEVVLRYLKEYTQDHLNILEIGCSSGSFLRSLQNACAEHFKDKQIVFTGLDIDNEAITAARQQSCDIHYINSSVESFTKTASEGYDLIIGWYIIEHLFDPLSFVTSLQKILNPGCLFIFSTNNIAGLDHQALSYNAMKRSLSHVISPPQHLNGFSTDNLKLFCWRTGFNFVAMGSFSQYDVDILTINRDSLESELYRRLTELDETAKGIFQCVLSELCATAYIYGVFKNL